MRARLTEREVVCLLLRNLDLPYNLLSLDRESDVIRIVLSPDEWAAVQKLTAKVIVDEIAEAWRELPREIWTDESWIARVCAKVCQFAPDYTKLFKTAAVGG